MKNNMDNLEKSKSNKDQTLKKNSSKLLLVKNKNQSQKSNLLLEKDLNRNDTSLIDKKKAEKIVYKKKSKLLNSLRKKRLSRSISKVSKGNS